MGISRIHRLGSVIDWLLRLVAAAMVFGVIAELLTTDDPLGVTVDLFVIAAIALIMVIRHQHRAAVEKVRVEVLAQVQELRTTHAEFQRNVDSRLDELNARSQLEGLDYGV